MHPILHNKRRLQVYLIAWIPIAGFVASMLTRGDRLSSLEAAVIAYPMCAGYAFVCLSSWYLCRATPLKESNLLRLVVTFGVAASLTSGMWLLAGRVLAALLDSLSIFPGLNERFTDQTQGLSFAGMLIFLLAATVHYLFLMVEQSRVAEKRELELRVHAREAELKALRAQIDPHFLFNSLNSISALTVQNPAGARRMCLLLGDFLRSSLKLGSQERISFENELKLAESFLDIEKIRFGDRLVVRFDIEPDCGVCLVPPLLIQPLIENAVTHGIAPLIDGGTLLIDARHSGANLEVVVKNTFDAELEQRSGTGVGLQNVGDRIRSMFGDRGGMDVERQDGWFKVTLRMPCAS